MGRRSSCPFPARLFVNELERRLTPTVFTVSSTANSGLDTLRQAIIDANANPGPDSIQFDPGVFGTHQTIALSTGVLSITSELTITGPAVGVTLKNTLANSHVIDVYQAANGTKVNFENLTITGGGATGGLTAGVYATGQIVSLTNCILTANTAASGVGAVSVFGGSLTIRGCTISNNIGTIGGGITINNGSLLLEDSAITGNLSTQNAGGGVRFSLAVQAGGFTIRNCTIANNTAVNVGGGIGLNNFTGTVTIQNSTITGNTLSSIVGGVPGGGGIGRLSGTGTIALTSSIVSGNNATVGPDIGTTGPVTLNFCAVGSSQGFSFTGAKNLAFQPVANLKLGTLMNNGGPTDTIALQPMSPCINAGSNPAMLKTDQRGMGYARDVNGVDIGAFEVQSQVAKVSALQVNDGTAQRSRVTSLTITFNTAVTLPANPADAFQLQRQSDSAAVALNASVMGNSVILTFTGGPVDFGSLADGRYTLTGLAAQINGGNFDGNGDGTPGDNYVLVGTPANGLFRLFGDADGDGSVGTADFNAFRNAFGGSSTIFDFDGSGSVGTFDFNEFRARFGSSI